MAIALLRPNDATEFQTRPNRDERADGGAAAIDRTAKPSRLSPEQITLCPNLRSMTDYPYFIRPIVGTPQDSPVFPGRTPFQQFGRFCGEYSLGRPDLGDWRVIRRRFGNSRLNRFNRPG